MPSFFEWFSNQNSSQPTQRSTEPSSTEPGSTEPSYDEPIVLFVTPGNEVTVPADEARNRTIGELFERYAEVLGIDAEQVSRYSDAGRVINRGAVPVPGRIYQASANSFTKGQQS